MTCSFTIFVNVRISRELKKHLNILFQHEEIETCTKWWLILDVREEAEYAFGHIEGAKSIPMGELEAPFRRIGSKIKKFM